jgi:hypothetical protein
LFISQFFLHKTDFLRIWPVDGPDKSDNHRICLRHEVTTVSYKAKYNCKQTIIVCKKHRKSHIRPTRYYWLYFFRKKLANLRSDKVWRQSSFSKVSVFECRVCVFSLYSLSTTFSNRCVFGEYAERIRAC